MSEWVGDSKSSFPGIMARREFAQYKEEVDFALLEYQGYDLEYFLEMMGNTLQALSWLQTVLKIAHKKRISPNAFVRTLVSDIEGTKTMWEERDPPTTYEMGGMNLYL